MLYQTVSKTGLDPATTELVTAQHALADALLLWKTSNTKSCVQQHNVYVLRAREAVAEAEMKSSDLTTSQSEVLEAVQALVLWKASESVIVEPELRIAEARDRVASTGLKFARAERMWRSRSLGPCSGLITTKGCYKLCSTVVHIMDINQLKNFLSSRVAAWRDCMALNLSEIAEAIKEPIAQARSVKLSQIEACAAETTSAKDGAILTQNVTHDLVAPLARPSTTPQEVSAPLT